MPTRIDQCLLDFDESLSEVDISDEARDRINERIDKLRSGATTDPFALTSEINNIRRQIMINAIGDAHQVAAREVNLQKLAFIPVEDQAQALNRDLRETVDVRPMQGMGRPSVEAQVASEKASLLNQVQQAIRSTQIEGMSNYARAMFKGDNLYNANNGDVLMKALLGMVDLGSISHLSKVDADIAQTMVAAKQVLREWSDKTLDRFAQAGVYIEEIPNFAPTRNADIEVIREYGFDNMEAWLAKNLDPAKYDSPIESVAQAFRQSFIDRGAGSSSGSISFDRQIHLISPEAEFEYFKLFTNGRADTAVLNWIDNMTARAVLAERYGPRPLDAVTDMVEQIKVDVNNFSAEGGKVSRFRQGQLQNGAINAVKGQLHKLGGDGDVSTLGLLMGSARHGMQAAALGMLSTYAITDAARSFGHVMAGAAGKQKGGILGPEFGTLSDTFNRTMKAYRTIHGDEAAQTLARKFGSVAYMRLGAVASRMMPETLGASSSTYASVSAKEFGSAGERFANKAYQWSQNSSEAAFKLFGAPFIQEQQQMANSVMLSGVLGELKGLSWQQLGDEVPVWRKRMERSGINDEVWAKVDDRAFVTDAHGSVFLDKELANPDIHHILAQFYQREGRSMLITPDQYLRDLTQSAGKTGSARGEFIRGLLLFHSFNAQAYRSYVHPMLRSSPGEMMRMMIPLYVGNLALVQAREILGGRPAYEPTSTDWYINGLGEVAWLAGGVIKNKYNSQYYGHKSMATVLSDEIVRIPWLDFYTGTIERSIDSAVKGDGVAAVMHGARMMPAGSVVYAGMGMISSITGLNTTGKTEKQLKRRERSFKKQGRVGYGTPEEKLAH